ncbi:MAG: HAD-IA family hydrolase [Nitratireductor sp.]|nr:HAD-IA family hydrolase [Nitratireductor sp.]
MPLGAVIFDVDGTLAETEEMHRKAFNTAFAEAGMDWHWDRDLYRRLLQVTGGKERITAYADEIGTSGIDAALLHKRKTAIYGESMVSGNVFLRPGIEDVIMRARKHGLKLAIATTTSRPNVEALISATLGSEAMTWFQSVRTGEDVSRKKPDPEVFELVMKDLGFPADKCLVFEDSANGLHAAKALDLPVIITPSIYTSEDDFSLADLVMKNAAEPLSHRKLMRVGGPIAVNSEYWEKLFA